MKPVLKTDTELLKETIVNTATEASRQTAELLRKEAAELSKKEIELSKKEVELSKKEAEIGGGTTGGSKVSQILRNATAQIPSDIEKEKERIEKERNELSKEKENFEKEKEKLMKPHNHEDSSELIDCPTCHKGDKNRHKLKNIGGGIVKCTGDGCGIEYGLIPKSADYKCTTCGLPHKKPAEVSNDDNCPFCGNSDFLKHDWSKILKPKAKK